MGASAHTWMYIASHHVPDTYSVNANGHKWWIPLNFNIEDLQKTLIWCLQLPAENLWCLMVALGNGWPASWKKVTYSSGGQCCKDVDYDYN